MIRRQGEIAQLETEAEEIRNTYVRTHRPARGRDNTAGGRMRACKETLAKLREQCAALPKHRPLLESGLIKVAERWTKARNARADEVIE